MITAKARMKGEKRDGLLIICYHVNNQFGAEQLDTIKEEEFCVPSEKILP